MGTMSVTVLSQNRFANLQIIGMTKQKNHIKVRGSWLEDCSVQGDKITIHKCVIDKAIKDIKANGDTYGSADREAGKIDILTELLDMISDGMHIDMLQKMKKGLWK